jgi:hypothetical protein
VSPCGLFRGCNRTLALGRNRMRLCHRSGPEKAEGERPDAMRVRSVVTGRVRLIKIVSRTSLLVTGRYCSESGRTVASPVSTKISTVKGVTAILALGAIKGVCG